MGRTRGDWHYISDLEFDTWEVMALRRLTDDFIAGGDRLAQLTLTEVYGDERRTVVLFEDDSDDIYARWWAIAIRPDGDTVIARLV